MRVSKLTNLENKDLTYYLGLPYPILLIPDEDGYWFAEIPLLPGCMSDGEDWNEAYEHISEAKRAWLETALANGIPEPEIVKL